MRLDEHERGQGALAGGRHGQRSQAEQDRDETQPHSQSGQQAEVRAIAGPAEEAQVAGHEEDQRGEAQHPLREVVVLEDEPERFTQEEQPDTG